MVRKLLIGLTIALLVIVGVSYLLPREVAVSRTAVIEAPPEEVFPHVNDLRAFQEWSPWADIDPDAELTFSGAESGEGQIMEWSSEHDSVGSGRQTITRSVENERVETALDFGDMGTATATFELSPADGSGTEVTWSFVGDMGLSPIGRWMGLMMDEWVGTDYERGLTNLKARVEGD